MATDRVTINLSPGMGEALERAAAADKRSVSNWVVLLIERDLSGKGLLPGAATEEAEMIAAGREYGVSEATKLLKRANRRRQAPAA